jgi:hypothetical protein
VEEYVGGGSLFFYCLLSLINHLNQKANTWATRSHLVVYRGQIDDLKCLKVEANVKKEHENDGRIRPNVTSHKPSNCQSTAVIIANC